MKKFTHAWIAFKAIQRLRDAQLTDENRAFADILIRYFSDHKDGVIRGAWYPDTVIVDNGTSHVMKYVPVAAPPGSPVPAMDFRVLPSKSLIYQNGRNSALHNKAFTIDSMYNLPERCEALSHAVIDNLRIMDREPKGSPLSPTANHAALVLFMLSHYIADAHMPLHCDDRPGTVHGFNLHDAVEDVWNQEVVQFYNIDRCNQRFVYDAGGFPLLKDDPEYPASILKAVEDELAAREFQVAYGQGNGNVREYMHAVCQYSYLLAYDYLPSGYDPAPLSADCLEVPGGMRFRQMSIIALADAVDAVARIWLRDLRRFKRWENENLHEDE